MCVILNMKFHWFFLSSLIWKRLRLLNITMVIGLYFAVSLLYIYRNKKKHQPISHIHPKYHENNTEIINNHASSHQHFLYSNFFLPIIHFFALLFWTENRYWRHDSKKSMHLNLYFWTDLDINTSKIYRPR